MSELIPSNDVIEEDGLKELNNLIPTYCCQTFFKKASTEASFDGNVNFFNDRNSSKKEGMIQIPVQIKSSTKDFADCKYSISTADLDNYKINGVCFFLIKLMYSKDLKKVVNKRILAKNFVGREILNLLTTVKEGQKSISVELNELYNQEDIEKLFYSYKLKQETVTQNNHINFTNNLSGKISLLDEKNNFTAFPEVGKQYFAFFDVNNEKYFANNFKIDEFHLPINGKVKVNNDVFFDSFEKIDKSNGEFQLLFNSALTLTWKKIGFKIEINKHSNIFELIKGLSFIISALNNKEFIIDNYKIPLLNSNKNIRNMVKEYKVIYDFATIIYDVFKMIGYNKHYSLMDLKRDDIISISKLYSNLQDNSVDYYFLETNLLTTMVVRVSSNTNAMFFNIFDENLYKCVKFKHGNNTNLKTTPFIYITIYEWDRMELASIDVFEKIIKENVSMDILTIKDYKIVINNLLMAFKKSNRNKLMDYALFLNKYFNFNFDLNRILEDLD